MGIRVVTWSPFQGLVVHPISLYVPVREVTNTTPNKGASNMTQLSAMILAINKVVSTNCLLILIHVFSSILVINSGKGYQLWGCNLSNPCVCLKTVLWINDVLLWDCYGSLQLCHLYHHLHKPIYNYTYSPHVHLVALVFLEVDQKHLSFKQCPNYTK